MAGGGILDSVKTIRGADLIIYINNKPFGVTTGIRYQLDEGQHPIYGIDQMTPFELASGQCSIKATVEVIRVRTQAGLEGAGIGIPETKVILKRYFSLSMVDRVTDTTILHVGQASAGTQAWGVNAKGELAGNFSFEGLVWTHELDGE